MQTSLQELTPLQIAAGNLHLIPLRSKNRDSSSNQSKRVEIVNPYLEQERIKAEKRSKKDFQIT